MARKCGRRKSYFFIINYDYYLFCYIFAHLLFQPGLVLLCTRQAAGLSLLCFILRSASCPRTSICPVCSQIGNISACLIRSIAGLTQPLHRKTRCCCYKLLQSLRCRSEAALLLFPAGIGEGQGGPRCHHELGHLVRTQKPLVKANSPWKAPRYLYSARSESGKGLPLWR